MSRSGKLIVFDGGDAVGKKTQSDKLAKRLIDEKFSLVTYSFPQYEKYFGKIVKQYLNGDFGKATDIHPKLASLLYALDRQQAAIQIKDYLANGGNVLCNRYIESNMGFQTAKLDNESDKKNFLEWLCETEYNQLGVPQSDLVIYLYLPIEASERLLDNRGEAKDGHEADRDFQRKVVDSYISLAKKYDHWRLVNCSASNGGVRTVDDIHEEVYSLVKPHL